MSACPHLPTVLLHQRPWPLAQVLPNKLPKLDLPQETDALAVLAPTGGQTSSSCKCTDLQEAAAETTATAAAVAVAAGVVEVSASRSLRHALLCCAAVLLQVAC